MKTWLDQATIFSSNLTLYSTHPQLTVLAQRDTEVTACGTILQADNNKAYPLKERFHTCTGQECCKSDIKANDNRAAFDRAKRYLRFFNSDEGHT